MADLLRQLGDKILVGDDCWEWQASLDRKGYGQLMMRPRLRRAHHVVYELMVGPIPEGSELDHVCRNKICVRPDHLEPVTHAENVRRYYATVTHCKYGHEFTPENTYLYVAKNCRFCLTCRRARDRKRYPRG